MDDKIICKQFYYDNDCNYDAYNGHNYNDFFEHIKNIFGDYHNYFWINLHKFLFDNDLMDIYNYDFVISNTLIDCECESYFMAIFDHNNNGLLKIALIDCDGNIECGVK